MSNDQFVDFGFALFKILSSVYSKTDSFTLLDACSFSHDLILYLGPSALEGETPSSLLFLK